MEKTDRIPEGVIRMNDERTHRYEYDSQHRLVHYIRTQHGETQAEGRYLYDPLGRRVGKRVWKREPVHWSDTRMVLSARPYETWYGWEGDRLTTVQTAQSRVQTVYAPGSFTPLVRIETDRAEQAKAQHRSLAEKLEQEGSEDGQAVQLPAALRGMLDRLEGELRRNAVSEESRAWLAGCGLTVEQMAGQLEPYDEPERKIHLYHCDQRGLPLALVSPDNQVAWSADYDEWGNLLGEENPENLEQLIRLPGQQYDEESGLYYNRHRYYEPGLGRYITQDPIGLRGGWNLYIYTSNPITGIDPLGLAGWSSLGSYINQPGFKSKSANTASEGADTTKPVSLRPDGYPWGYGCGDESTDKFVPDSLYGVSFMQACRNHDICYGTPGSSKQSCDTHLGDDIVLACNKVWKDTLSSEDMLYKCYTAAGIYQLAVEKKGGPAFEAAQREAAKKTIEFGIK